MAQDVAPLLELSSLERSLITLLQASFPLVERPFEAAARLLGSDESTVLDRLTRLKEARLIRKIGPVFEPARFGVSSELIAVRVSPARLEAVGEAVSAWPAVTHCYARSHDINLWLAALSADTRWFENATPRILDLPGATGVWRLPALRRFKVAVWFDLTDGKGSGPASAHEAGDEPLGRCPAAPPADQLQHLDSRWMAALEADLPLCPEPFAALASAHGAGGAEILEALQALKADGRIRRYGALVSHRLLGFVANAMTVWHVPAERVEEVGAALASSAHVSHCYERPAFPEFPFNLYAMVHERSREQCLSVIEDLARDCGEGPPAVLWSTKEFKKSSPSYADMLGQSVCGSEAPCPEGRRVGSERTGGR